MERNRTRARARVAYVPSFLSRKFSGGRFQKKDYPAVIEKQDSKGNPRQHHCGRSKLSRTQEEIDIRSDSYQLGYGEREAMSDAPGAVGALDERPRAVADRAYSPRFNGLSGQVRQLRPVTSRFPVQSGSPL